MRVTQAYHKALRRAWVSNNFGSILPFTVREAALAFPPLARRYTRVLEFLRGPELKRAIRLAAREQHIPYVPGASRTVRTCDYWTKGSQRSQFELARLCVSFCEALNVPATIKDVDGAYIVQAHTSKIGAAALRRHPGVSVYTIRRFLDIVNVPLSGPFWWLPQNVSDSALVNPLLRCINTPDYQEYAKEIIFQ